MDADNKQAFKKLLIRLALLCLLMAAMGTVVLVLLGGQSFVPLVIIGFLLSLGAAAWMVRASPLWMATPALKALLYLIGIVLAPVMLGAMLFVSILVFSSHIEGFGKSGGGSSRHSNPFD